MVEYTIRRLNVFEWTWTMSPQQTTNMICIYGETYDYIIKEAYLPLFLK